MEDCYQGQHGDHKRHAEHRQNLPKYTRMARDFFFPDSTCRFGNRPRRRGPAVRALVGATRYLAAA